MDETSAGMAVVVWDPSGEYADGSLVEGARRRVLELRGAAVLPVDPDLLRRSGVGGYMRRAWGAGYPMPASMLPRTHAPLLLFASREHARFHWAARLSILDEAQLERARGGATFDGRLSLGGDSGQSEARMPGIRATESPVNLRDLGKPDALDGWTLRGATDVTLPGDGHYGLALYGAAPGFCVQWAAVSATRR